MLNLVVYIKLCHFSFKEQHNKYGTFIEFYWLNDQHEQFHIYIKNAYSVQLTSVLQNVKNKKYNSTINPSQYSWFYNSFTPF